MNILAPLLNLVGTISIGIWGFPITRTPERYGLTRKETTRRYIGVVLLGIGFALQLASEVLSRFQ